MTKTQQTYKNRRKFSLPRHSRGSHESEESFLRRMKRQEAIDQARLSPSKVTRDGKEFTVIHLPDNA